MKLEKLAKIAECQEAVTQALSDLDALYYAAASDSNFLDWKTVDQHIVAKQQIYAIREIRILTGTTLKVAKELADARKLFILERMFSKLDDFLSVESFCRVS